MPTLLCVCVCVSSDVRCRWVRNTSEGLAAGLEFSPLIRFCIQSYLCLLSCPLPYLNFIIPAATHIFNVAATFTPACSVPQRCLGLMWPLCVSCFAASTENELLLLDEKEKKKHIPHHLFWGTHFHNHVFHLQSFSILCPPQENMCQTFLCKSFIPSFCGTAVHLKTTLFFSNRFLNCNRVCYIMCEITWNNLLPPSLI